MGSDLVTAGQSAFLRGLEKRFEKAGSIIQAALDAPEIDQQQVEAQLASGQPLTREQRIAMHALEPTRNAPMYLGVAKELVMLKAKLDAGMGDDAPKLVHHMVHMFKPKEYERVDLKSREKSIEVEAKVVNGDQADKGSASG